MDSAPIRPGPIRLATRGSPLARWQADRVAALLEIASGGGLGGDGGGGRGSGGRGCEVVVVETTGDRRAEVPVAQLGGQGAFVVEIQRAVLEGRADIAVHSAKDLPSTTPAGLVLACVPERADPRDALVGSRLADLAPGARVATGSVRRRVQLAWLRPDLTFVELRGNMATRLERAAAEGAGVVAMAALERLGLSAAVAEVLDTLTLLPQVAQGALAVECRADDDEIRTLLAGIDNPVAHAAVTAERAFLAEMGGGCTLPVGALATPSGFRSGAGPVAPAPGETGPGETGPGETGPGETGPGETGPGETGPGEMVLEGLLASRDGRILLRRQLRGSDPTELGRRLASDLLDHGGRVLDDWDLVGDARGGRGGRGGAMTVYLVGAGPGDPGLLTRRGAEVLGRADVVVFDRLVPAALLELAPAQALRIDMGKRPGQTGRQEQIDALLIEHGADKTVVRLKGGDPFVFGRGAEEIEALRAAGIDYEVVPGVTSAFAAPAAAGVPVTHRGLSTSVTVVTGHVGDPSAPGGVAWEALARAGGTLVILMGMEHRQEIARLLLEGGRPPDTPVMVVQWGTTTAQRSVRVTLDQLHAVELGPPSTIVVGAVAGLDLGGPAVRPLSGVSVVVTRPRDQAPELGGLLAETGADVVFLPVIAITDPADGGALLAQAARGAGAYDWIVFTSVNAVDRFLGLVRDGRDLGGVRLAAVGPATAAALGDWHLVPDLVAGVGGDADGAAGAGGGAEGLVAEMPSARDGSPARRVLYPRAADVRDVLTPGLRDKGWDVDEVEAYRTVTAGPDDGATPAAVAAASAADVILFTSPSTVTSFLALSEGKTPGLVACIGPVTAEAARAAGLVVDAVATDHSAAGLVDALVSHWWSKSST